MSSRSDRRLLAALLLAACGGSKEAPPVEPSPTLTTPETGTLIIDTGTPPTTWERTPPTDTAADPCADPLVASLPQPGVLSRQDLRVDVVGGVGPYAFALSTNASGGSINAVSGAYLAGPTPGVVDTVTVTDPVCGLSTTVDILVFLPLQVAPLTAELLPGTAFTLQIREGSGAFRCAVDRMGSGGTLTNCDYVAGPDTGTDRIDVVDELTGEVVQTDYAVVDQVDFHPWGDRWLLPLGHPFPMAVVGGSATVDAVVGAGLQVDDQTLIPLQEGAFTVDLTDRFTGLTASVDVVVSAPHTTGTLRDGERIDLTRVITGDLDGDGYHDAVISSVDAGVQAWLGGGVFVYRGGPGGLDPVPVQAFGDPVPNSHGGRSIALGDVNGDGVLDLAWGAPFTDLPGLADIGVVRVHAGQGDGTFAATPTWERWGTYGGDQAGYALALCDVDGDGLDDLAVTAGRAEDRAAVPIVYDTGGLWVYRGNPGGPSLHPDWEAWPAYPDGGAWVSRNTGFGFVMAAGDADGDGRCDLAAATWTENLTDSTDIGVVWRFLATDLTGAAPVRPSRVYAGATDGQFGVDMAYGDPDGDGLDDLLVGARYDDTVTTNAGAAWLFLAAADDGRAATEPMVATEAAWAVQGDNGSDYVGFGVGFGDLDGDGLDDVIVGAPLDEALGTSPSSAGMVAWWPGAEVAAGGVVRMTDATRYATQTVANTYLGVSVGAGDVDGDGVDDLLGVASRTALDGVEVSLGYVLGATPVELAMPAGANASFLGDRGTATWFDADGDGRLDLVGGAPSQPDPAFGYNTGGLHIWWGAASGTPGESWPGPFGNGANDRLGYAVASAGDFDGDGREDLAVVAWNESRPATFDPAVFANPDDCPGSLSGAGALWIHRGTASGLSPDPSWVAYGYSAGDHIDRLTAADLDGDGRSEVIFGATGTSDTGGVGIVRGRAAAQGLVTVVCDVETVLGVSVGSRMGADVATLGDLDGDGCDEVAVGADLDDLGVSNRGSVRVLWGDGASCSGPAVTTLGITQGGARLGDAVAAGGRIDDDLVPDLFVGAYAFDDGGLSDRGAAWWVSGSWVAGLPKQTAPGWVLPADTATTVHLLDDTHRLMGAAAWEEAGRGVGMVTDPDRAGRALLAFGRRFGNGGAGGAELWRVTGGALEARPAALVGGETLAPRGQLGDWLVGHPDAPVLLVGAPYGDGVWLDEGVVYTFEL